MSNEKIYAKTAQQVLEFIEQAQTLPWQKPWTGEMWPMNLHTRKRYNGVNVLRLLMQPYGSRWWVSFKQAMALGGSVKKGEQSTAYVVFSKSSTVTVEKDGEEHEKSFWLLRVSPVFNVEQCTEEVQKWVPKETARDDVEPSAAFERFLGDLPQQPTIHRTAWGRAFYRPSTHEICVPPPAQFKSEAHRVATEAHELGHWTGHSSILGRFEPGVNTVIFGSESYSKEELIAEFFAAMVVGHCGIADENLLKQSGAYIQGWAEKIRDEPRILHDAIAQAQKAFTWCAPHVEKEDTGELAAQEIAA